MMIVSFSNLDLAQVRLRLPPLKDKQQEMTLWEFISTQKSVSASLNSIAEVGYRAQDYMVEVFDVGLQRFVEAGKLSLGELAVEHRHGSKHMRVSVTAIKGSTGGCAAGGALAIAGKAFALKDGGVMPLTIKESPQTTLDLRFPDINDTILRDKFDGKTGLSTWDAAVCLAQFLSLPQHKEGILKDRHILELGAGTGVVGISSAFLGARSIQLTDLSYVLDNLRRNVEINADLAKEKSIDLNLADVITVRELDWNNPDSYYSHFSSTGPVDVILAADVAWLEHLVTPLANTIKALVENDGAVVYLSHQSRSVSVDSALFGALRETLSVEEIPRAKYHQRYISDKIKILKLVAKHSKDLLQTC